MRIAIVGGGLSGTIACLQLLRSDLRDLHIALIERAPAQLNRGVAYSATLSQQLLNVRAARMGLFPDAVEGFHHWAVEGPLPGAKKDAFLPRDRFGDFVQQQFREALERHPGRVSVHDQEAIGLATAPSGGQRVQLANGAVLEADRVLLALGNAPSAPVPHTSAAVREHPRYIHSPWKPGVLENIREQEHVLFIGAGLTMVDLLLSLKNRGHRGPVTVVSRRGLLPGRHVPPGPWQLVQPPPDMQHAELVDLLRWMRAEVRHAEARGIAWPNVVDAARPFVRTWWQALSTEKRRSFMRHLRPFWEVHRHRMPAEAHDRIRALCRSGQVRMVAARVRGVQLEGNRLGVDLAHRQGGTGTLLVDHLLNCTGPDPDVRRTDQRLLATLLEQGRVSRDELGLGLQCTAEGAVIDQAGQVSDRLFLLGPMCRAAVWECTAVPEIREQVADLVQRFASVSLLLD